MPFHTITYSGIVTKSKAMSSKLISLTEYEYIAQLETTTDFFTFLKQQPGYESIYEHFTEDDLHRGKIEHFLMNALYRDYAKLYAFSPPKQRKSLDLIFLRYEVNILKSCLQCVFNHEKIYDLSLFEPFFNKYSKLNINKLVSCDSMEEFISNLKETSYFTLFTKLYNTDHQTLYDYEVQLDIFYFERMWKLIKQTLKGREKDAMVKTLGHQIDFLNILWVYRSKKFYTMDIGKIYASIIPVHYRLTTDQVSKLVEVETHEGFMNILKNTYYKNITDQEQEPLSMELSYRKLMDKIYRSNKQKYPSSMAPIYSFLHLKEQEIDQLTSALECIRYQLDPNQTLNYIQS